MTQTLRSGYAELERNTDSAQPSGLKQSLTPHVRNLFVRPVFATLRFSDSLIGIPHASPLWTVCMRFFLETSSAIVGIFGAWTFSLLTATVYGSMGGKIGLPLLPRPRSPALGHASEVHRVLPSPGRPRSRSCAVFAVTLAVSLLGKATIKEHSRRQSSNMLAFYLWKSTRNLSFFRESIRLAGLQRTVNTSHPPKAKATTLTRYTNPQLMTP